jgi:hypothetical protein
MRPAWFHRDSSQEERRHEAEYVAAYGHNNAWSALRSLVGAWRVPQPQLANLAMEGSYSVKEIY